MNIIFRVLDRNHGRAQRAERELLTALKAHGLTGQVQVVYETLEFSRLGLTELPGLDLNGLVLCQGRELEPDFVDDLCRRLARAKRELKYRNEKAETA